MKQVALIVLLLPDNQLVMQRRTKDAPISPGKLGFFGGHIEKEEEPYVAIRRELEEETSLNIDSLAISLKYKLNMKAAEDPSSTDTTVHLFGARILDIDFQVYEGDQAEAYSLEALTQRQDLGDTARFILKHVPLT
jgi:8-oxo-dGTP pyrophosphatase MutT (NUDIX family)